jgi:hypothetical protein
MSKGLVDKLAAEAKAVFRNPRLFILVLTSNLGLKQPVQNVARQLSVALAMLEAIGLRRF